MTTHQDAPEALIEELEMLLRVTRPEWKDPARFQQMSEDVQSRLAQLEQLGGANDKKVAELRAKYERRLQERPSPTPNPHRAADEVKRWVERNGYTGLEKLQTGNFSTGYTAMDAEKQKVMVKIPSEDTWNTRFDACATAMREEASILVRVNSLFKNETLTPSRGVT